MTGTTAVAVTVMAPHLRRRLARASFVGAAALLVAAAWPGSPSRAEAAPDFDYAAVASAVGIQAQLDSNPEPTPVPDLTDLEVPTSNGRLDSFGTASAQGDVGNLNGLAKLPSLICLAAGGCDSFPAPAGVTFPQADPLEADASDPGTPDAVAPSVAGNAATVEGGQAGVATYSAGVAHAHAAPLATHTDAGASGLDLLGGISVGAVRTTSDQSVAEAGVTTSATSTVSDIAIGTGLIHIGSVAVTTSVTAVPGTTPTDQSSVSVAGVTAFGEPATIDGTGLHIASSSPAAAQLQTLLGNTLTADGLTLSVGGITRSDADDGHHVTGNGLILTLDTPVSGLPPVNVGLPEGVPCPIPGELSGQLPVDPCSGVGLNLDAAYHGQIVLGSAGTVDEALTNPLLSGLPTFALPDAPAASPGASTAAASPAPVSPGPAGTHTAAGGHLPQSAAGATDPTGAGGSEAAPEVAAPTGSAAPAAAGVPAGGSGAPPAGRQQASSALLQPLEDIGLGWVLGAFGLAGLGMLLGRWRVPARLPSRS